uniref:Uncharacterized protein n=1 Tax=Cacopsylla melanoneura TaxID=428564 RepID=A0A8D8VV76_9HEMI
MEYKFNFELLPVLENKKVEEFNFKKTNFNLLKYYLSEINWQAFFNENQSLEKIVSTFYNVLHTGIDYFVPKCKPCKFKFPVWFSKALKEKVIQKKIFHKKFKSSHNNLFYDEFKKLRRDCKNLAHIDHDKYIKSTEKLLCKNPRKFLTL